MFLESLLETSTQAKTRRGWATVTSFLIEFAVVGLLILLPLLYTEALPTLQWITLSVTGPPAGESRPSHAQGTRVKPRPQPVGPERETAIRVPTDYPDHPYQPTEPEQAADSAETECTGVCIPGGIGPGGNNPVIASVLDKLPAEPRKPESTGPVLLQSRITEGMLIRRVQPIYPPLAIQTRIQGTVVLRALIGRDGVIHGVEALSGHPLLIPAAVDAVRQWRYRPYILNGQPVEVETSVTVNFILNR